MKKEHARKCETKCLMHVGETKACDCDGYHTFEELYAHRIALYMALCATVSSASLPINEQRRVWKSKYHNDGSKLPGWFIMGINFEKGEQISYHLPIHLWDECGFAEEMNYAPEWDGHTPDDTLDRLKTL